MLRALSLATLQVHALFAFHHPSKQYFFLHSKSLLQLKMEGKHFNFKFKKLFTINL